MSGIGKLVGPDIRPSRTLKVVLGCGNIYITVDDRSDTDNRPWRVFMKRGKKKAGDCTRVLMEAVARSATIMLQEEVPLERICRTYRGMRCEKGYVGHLSCMDELAIMLGERMVKEDGDDGAE